MPGLVGRQAAQIGSIESDPIDSLYAAIVEIVVDESALKLGQFSMQVDPWIFKNGVMTFDGAVMDALNKAIVAVNHVL